MKHKLVGLVALGLVASGCAAEPREVCDHMGEVVRKDLGAPAADEVTDGCEFTWRMRKETKGVFQYKQMADCVMDADSADALEKCD